MITYVLKFLILRETAVFCNEIEGIEINENEIVIFYLKNKWKSFFVKFIKTFIMKIKHDNSYLQSNRLSDVIRLLVVLAVDKQNFRTEQGINGRLQDNPKSASTWLELAKDHPEFFRFNKDKTSIILLIRFIQKVDVEDGETRDPFSVEETQKLVDQAISLHDKQLARYQRDSYKTTITAAYIAAGATIITGIIALFIAMSSNHETENIKKQLDNISKEISKTNAVK